MKQPQLSGIATALAAQGRNGDDTLIHVSRKELETLRRMGDGIGIHLTKNPQTGLPEAFNWLGALGGVVGGVIGTFIAPGAGTAAGAAIGSAAGTAAGGGSTKQALIAGVLGGITGYAGAGIAGGIADVGAQAAAQGAEGAIAQGAAQGVTQATTDVAAQGVTQGATDVAAQGVTQATTDAASQSTLQSLAQQGAQQAGQVSNTLLPQTGSALAEGSSKALGSVVGESFVPNAVPMQSVPLSYGDKLAAGWNQVTSTPQAFGNFVSSNLKPIASVGMGTLGIGALNPTETSIVNPDTADNQMHYRGEMYTDPATGQRRSRAVPLASGGEVFGQYDDVEAAADGGYIPGGGLNFAKGGSAQLYRKLDSLHKSRFDTGGVASASPEAIVIANTEPADWLEGVQSGRIPTGGRRRRQDEYAVGGGIGSLGSYSDGGRMLRGPGDGVSDSIPASIEGKRPARLADGEFVVPARAVSELGNGSSEAGSKQLYAMLDRIAAKRKKGKGLAYESNPKKLLPA